MLQKQKVRFFPEKIAKHLFVLRRIVSQVVPKFPSSKFVGFDLDVAPWGTGYDCEVRVRAVTLLLTAADCCLHRRRLGKPLKFLLTATKNVAFSSTEGCNSPFGATTSGICRLL